MPFYLAIHEEFLRYHLVPSRGAVWGTRFSMLDWVRVAGLSCTKGVAIYMIGILDSLSDVWKASTGTPPCKLLRVNTLR